MDALIHYRTLQFLDMDVLTIPDDYFVTSSELLFSRLPHFALDLKFWFKLIK